MNIREIHPQQSSRSLAISLGSDRISVPLVIDDGTFYSAKISASVGTASSSGIDGSEEEGSYILRSFHRNKNCKKTSEKLKLNKHHHKVIKPITFHYQIQSSNDSSMIKQPLDIEAADLIGRDTEITRLKACLSRMMLSQQQQQASDDHSDKTSKNSCRELVLIAGFSGSRMSTVVARSLEQDVSLVRTNGLFVQGKFEMNSTSEPYSGISKAFGEICRRVLLKSDDPESISEVRMGIIEELGHRANVLVPLIPELKDLIITSKAYDEPGMIDIGNDEIDSRLERLRFAFRALTKVLSDTFSPLVLFLDDLQWADISSLQILEFLISDTQNENPFMIIGCYRSEEVDENSLLYQKITSLREKAETFKFHMTEMAIEPFGKDEVEQVIQNIMKGHKAGAPADLAALCHKRTLGNPFFVIEFLKLLHQEGFFLYNTSSKTWSWDLVEIEKATMSTANVAMMLQERITKLPQQEQTLLQCAAYLGSTFSKPMIDIVWKTYGRRLVENRIHPTGSLLTEIVKEDILEKVGSHQYRWVHDQLQEAALHLSEERRESFQLDIGRTLYYGLKKEEVEDELFAIVDLINNGNVLKLPEFAHANLRAAEKARELSAFQSAAEYAAHGASLLRENKWEEDRSLTLGLFVMGAEMELMVGNVTESRRYSDEVLAQRDLAVMDTFRMKIAKANTLGYVDLKFDDSLDSYIQLLRELGQRVTRSRRLVPVQAIAKLVGTTKRAKSKPMTFYDTMVPINDPKQKAIVSVFSKMIYTTIVSGDIPLHLLCVCVLVEMTLNHGLNEFSAKCFASLGNGLVIARQDFKTARIFINIALSMLKKFRGMHASETIFIANMTLCWVKPLEKCMSYMLESVPEGLRSGDSEYAIWNLFSVFIAFPYILGKPIASILKECNKVFVQSEDAAQAAHSGATKILWQMLHNLSQPLCQNPTELEGDIFSAANTDTNDNVHIAISSFARGELSVFLSDYETTAKRASTVGDKFEKLIPNYPLIMIDTFHRAVALYAAALRTKKRKYRVEGRRLSKKISRWVKHGNPNVRYYPLFLQAEQLALDKMYDKAEERYEEALEAATKEGRLHHLGLINERYAEFLEGRPSKQKKSEVRLREAIRYYKEWGAEAKVKTLETKL